MSESYKRIVYIVVGIPGEKGKRIEGLYIHFEVEKDDTSSPNTAKITVHNLNKDSVALINRENAVVQLFAGYGDEANLLFIGDITRVVTVVEGPEAKTTIESGDGQAALSKSRSSVNLKGATSVGEVLKQALKGIVKNPVKALLGVSTQTKNKALRRGYSASGPTRVILDGLALSRAFDWFYQDGEIVVVDRNAPLKQPAILVTPETGLIGSPAILSDKKRKGIQFKFLLNGRVLCRRIARVESASYTGFYLVRKLTHRGDSGFGSDFFTVAEATALS